MPILSKFLINFIFLPSSPLPFEAIQIYLPTLRNLHKQFQRNSERMKIHDQYQNELEMAHRITYRWHRLETERQDLFRAVQKHPEQLPRLQRVTTELEQIVQPDKSRTLHLTSAMNEIRSKHTELLTKYIHILTNLFVRFGRFVQRLLRYQRLAVKLLKKNLTLSAKNAQLFSEAAHFFRSILTFVDGFNSPAEFHVMRYLGELEPLMVPIGMVNE